MAQGVVYLVTNLVNGRQYVGQTIDYVSRCRDHIKSAKVDAPDLPFARAIKKYGEYAFEFSCLSDADDRLSLNAIEDWFIVIFDTIMPNGYNLRRGGSLGSPHPETIRRISSTSLERWSNPLYKERLVASFRRAALTRDYKKQTQSYWDSLDEEGYERHCRSVRTALASPIERAARSERSKEALNRPEVIAKISINSKKYYSNPAAREQSRQNTLQTWRDPEIRRSRSEGVKKALADPLIAKKMSRIRSNMKWITNGVITSRIQVNELLPVGWRYGRK